MSEQVIGSIGQDQIVLNNAASEATLRLILEGIRASSSGAAAAIDKMAAKAGIDTKTIEAANQEVKKSTTGFKNLKDATDLLTPSFNTLVAATEKITRGNAQASEMMDFAFGRTTGIIGVFATGLIKLAEFQEQGLASYRGLTQAGVNFGGSLTDLRMAAANSYMTLGDFSALLKTNTQNLLNLGGSVNGGAVAFAKFSNSMLKSPLGDQLLALGYSAEEANQGMLNYLGAAGVSNAKDLQSNEALRKGASEYLNEMDRLAQVTGKGRKEQEDIMRQQKLNAEIQMTASRMKDPVARAAFEQNVKYMSAQFGDAGKDMALAQAQGRAVITKEGQMLTALAPGMQQAYQRMVQAGNQFGVGSKQYIEAQRDVALAAKDGFDRIPIAIFSANASIKQLSDAQLTVAQMTKQGLVSKEAIDARDAKVAADKSTRERSQALDAALTQKALQDLGIAVLAAIMPIVSTFSPILNKVVQGFAFLIEKMMGLNIIVMSLTAAFIAHKAIQTTQAGIKNLKQNSKDGISSVFKQSVILGSKTNPMYVIIVGSGPGGLTDLLDKKGRKPITAKTGPGTPANRAARIASVQKGRVAQTAMAVVSPLPKAVGAMSALKGIKVPGVVGALAGVSMLASEISDINDKLKDGKISESDASKQKGGAVGEASGGLAGGLAGAAVGAAIGSVVPIIGTAIGGIIGGIIGGFGGGQLGRSIGEGPKDPPKLADGGIVTRSTSIIAGEAGPEAIIPLDKFEKLQTELATLNTSMQEVVKYMRDTAENTKKTHLATKALNGNLYSA